MEVGLVCLYSIRIPFAGEYTAAALLLESSTDATDAGEQIDESELALARRWLTEGQKALADRIGDVGLGFGLAQLPAADRLRINSQCLGDLLGAEALEGEVDQFVRVHGCSGNSGDSMSNFFPWVKWGNQGLPRHAVGATPLEKGGGARRSSPKRMAA
ncbi:hypothetical protein D3C71_1560740 [compost metagenome]